MTFAATSGSGNYAGGALNGGATGGLTKLNASGLIDSQLGSGSKSGYAYNTVGTDAAAGVSEASFVVGAKPLVTSGVSQTGTRRFCVNTDGVVKADATEASLATQIATEAACTAITTIVQ